MGYFTTFNECGNLPGHAEVSDPDKSPEENASSDGFEATRIYELAWASRILFVNRILGYAVGKTLYFPHRYPNCEAAVAVSASVKGQGLINPPTYPLTWQKAFISVNYKTQEYETRIGKTREPYITETLEGAAEFITVPADGLYWDADLTESLTDAEAPGMLRKMKTWVYTMHRLPEVPSILDSWIGFINKQPLRSYQYNQNFPAGTLLFGVPTIQSGVTLNGDLSYTVSINLTYNPFGWNKLIRKGGRLPQPIYAEVEVDLGGGHTELRTKQYDIYGVGNISSILPTGTGPILV